MSKEPSVHTLADVDEYQSSLGETSCLKGSLYLGHLNLFDRHQLILTHSIPVEEDSLWLVISDLLKLLDGPLHQRLKVD